MGKMTRLNYTVLDELIADRGEDWMLERLLEGTLEGKPLKEIADGLGVKWWVFREWVEANCADKVALADRERAELLVKKTSDTVDCSDTESLPVDKFQSDQWMKLAGKLNRAKYGEKTEVSVTNTHTFDIRGLLAQREARLAELSNETLEGECVTIATQVDKQYQDQGIEI